MKLAQQDRLRDNDKSLQGLLSLIPAKYYYGEDNSVCAIVHHFSAS
jgi:hypothetical protein